MNYFPPLIAESNSTIVSVYFTEIQIQFSQHTSSLSVTNALLPQQRNLRQQLTVCLATSNAKVAQETQFCMLVVPQFQQHAAVSGTTIHPLFCLRQKPILTLIFCDVKVSQQL